MTATPRPNTEAVCIECGHAERIGENGENVCSMCGGWLAMVATEPPGIEVTASFTVDQAWALAELCKRIGWNELRGNAANENEAYTMRDAVNRLQGALAEAGFSPR